MDRPLQDFHCDTLVRSTAFTGTTGHSANHRLHRSSSWKCLANPHATCRNGLWWTWHLFISSIFGTKCWSSISSMTSSSSLRVSRSRTPPQRLTIADTTAVVVRHPRFPWTIWCTPHKAVGAVQCSALQGPSTVQFAQSVSDIHLPVSHPSWRSAALARWSLKWPQAWPTSEEKLEKGWMQYAILHTTNTLTQMNSYYICMHILCRMQHNTIYIRSMTI